VSTNSEIRQCLCGSAYIPAYSAASCSILLNSARWSENPSVLWRNLWSVRMRSLKGLASSKGKVESFTYKAPTKKDAARR
jgi:hypothetical protein